MTQVNVKMFRGEVSSNVLQIVVWYHFSIVRQSTWAEAGPRTLTTVVGRELQYDYPSSRPLPVDRYLLGGNDELKAYRWA